MAITVDEFNKRRLRSSNITVTLSIALVLFLAGLSGLILINAQKYSDYIKEQLVMEVYFDEYLDPRDSIKVQKFQEATLHRVAAHPVVKKVRFISEKEASEIAKKQLGIDTNALFEVDIFPASVEVTLKPESVDPERIDNVVKQLTDIEGVKEVKNDSKFMQEIYYNLNRILFWIFGFTIVFLVVAIILINNSIRLKIFSKRFIIKTMQLVGAKRRFILKPFIKEATVIGIIGAFIGLSLLSLVWYFFTSEIGSEFIGDTGQFILFIFSVIGMGIGISVFSTVMATWRFLKSNVDDLYYL